MQIIEYVGNCSDREISKLAEKRGRKFSYKKAVKLIREYSQEFYDSLGLEFYNPWENDTNIIDGKYLHINHSMIDYIFLLHF